MTTAFDPAAMTHAIESIDFVRRSPFSVGGAGAHKEWQHFVVFGRDLDLLVNFSLSDDVRPMAPRGSEIPRVVVLSRNGNWDGDVESFDPARCHIAGGTIDLRFGTNRLRFVDGAYHIEVKLDERPIEASLRLEPTTQPAAVPALSMLDGPPLRWAVVPRLQVYGSARIGDRTYDLDGALAYHDHNWGHFLWGHDVSWDWGFVLPEDPAEPWSATFVRLTNRARSIALAHTVLVWKHERLLGMFRETEVQVELDPRPLRPHRIFRVPRAMALAACEQACDVPAGIRFEGRNGGGMVECNARCEQVSQVLIPRETRLGVTIFNEVFANTEVRGRLHGESFAFRGRSILEFIREA